jgi:hypothetical protein
MPFDFSNLRSSSPSAWGSPRQNPGMVAHFYTFCATSFLAGNNWAAPAPGSAFLPVACACGGFQASVEKSLPAQSSRSKNDPHPVFFRFKALIPPWGASRCA